MEKFLTFCEEVSKCPPQHSEEWYEKKKDTIGGSEMDSVERGYKKRARGRKPTGRVYVSDALQWGTFWEDTPKTILSELCGLCVIVPGAIDGLKDGDKTLSVYSADGVALATKDCSVAGVDIKKDDIILIEIKCPYTRIPNGQVPERYMPQVLSGLDTINVCDYAIFIDTYIRTCKLRWFHPGSTLVHGGVIDPKETLYMGWVTVYPTGESWETITPESTLDDLDISEIYIKNAHDLSPNTCVTTWFTPDQYRMPNVAEVVGAYGIVCFKITKMDLVRVDRQVGYLESRKSLIKGALEDINCIYIPAEDFE